MSFVHLHCHSHFSFLEALPSPAELVKAAARLGMPALALTDRIGLSGAVEFYLACKEEGVKPILGLQIPVGVPLDLPVASGELVFLAIDRRGWRSLCRLSSMLLTEQAENPYPVVPFELLESESDGLICLTGGSRGPLASAMRAGGSSAGQRYVGYLRDIFKDRVYAELHIRTSAEAELVEEVARLAKRFGLPLVATNDVHYLLGDGMDRSGVGELPDDVALQRLVTAIRLNRRLGALSEGDCPPPDSHLASLEEMKLRFAGFPEACQTALEVAERCQLQLPLDQPLFPQIASPSGEDANTLLRKRAEAGALERYGVITPEIRSRLDHELAVIASKNYAPLFLIVADIVEHAQRIGVPLSSRGSAASSLVAYCLKITSPDPLRLNLYFERFLNPARASPPDIDTDLCSRRRDEVIRYVYERYGADHVAMVGTVNRFRRRSALRETAKAFGFPVEEISRLVEQLPYRWRRTAGQKGGSPYAELEARYTDRRHQTLFAAAGRLIGRPRHLSIHPGGVVITPQPLTDLVPTQLATKGVVITQFDLDAIARLGLVKIDLLGIRGLSVLGDVAEAIRARQPGSYPTPLAPLESIPDEDPATVELLQTGKTIGCFQIESPGMRATLKQIQARSIDDLMVALALYRPGPLTGGLRDAFVRRHRGEEPVSHLHPALAPLLEDTHGVVLYQEQVLRIAHELAGLSLADADLLRRAMSHFDPGKAMQTLRERFISGAQERSDVPLEIAERIWELMAAFAGYGFPKAHAASYAQIAWRSAWCKAHEPAVFMAAVLANWGGYYPQRVYINETRRMGLRLRAPHINYARHQFSLSYLEGQPVLFMGLDQVRELTDRTQARILRERPFHSLVDFLTRVDPRPQEVENLIRCGALEGFGTIPDLLRQVKGGIWQGGQLPLFPLGDDQTVEGDWGLRDKVAAQEEILGVGVDAHPLELVSDQIAAADALTTVEAAGRIGERVRLAGMRFSWRRSRDQHGNYVYRMALEDLEGILDVVIPEKVYARFRTVFSAKSPIVIEGEIRFDEMITEPVIWADKAWRMG